MERVAQAPEAHLFVCANRRDATDPLGAGCGERGETVFAALKEEVAKERAYARVWVTKTHCLGICPRTGCTVAVYGASASDQVADGASGPILRDVDETDARALVRRMLRAQ